MKKEKKENGREKFSFCPWGSKQRMPCHRKPWAVSRIPGLRASKELGLSPIWRKWSLLTVCLSLEWMRKWLGRYRTCSLGTSWAEDLNMLCWNSGPQKLWSSTCVLFQTARWVGTCYAGIENEYMDVSACFVFLQHNTVLNSETAECQCFFCGRRMNGRSKTSTPPLQTRPPGCWANAPGNRERLPSWKVGGSEARSVNW